MKSNQIINAAVLSALLLAAACKTQTPADGGLDTSEPRPLIISPVVSSAVERVASRATIATTPVTLVGGNLTLTLKRSAAAGASSQLAVYRIGEALAYEPDFTREALLAVGLDPDKARPLYVTAAGDYPLLAEGYNLTAATTQSFVITHTSSAPITVTSSVPFGLNARRTADQAPLSVAADGTMVLPLHIASIGLMLRMKHSAGVAGKPFIFIDSVRCLYVQQTAPHIRDAAAIAKAKTASRVVTATTKSPDAPAGSPGDVIADLNGNFTSYVLFGTIPASQPIQAGVPMAEIYATISTSDGETVKKEQKIFTVTSPSTITPKAGQLLSYTVHVNQSIASISDDGVTISDFTPGQANPNGEGVGDGVVVVADGNKPLDPTLFCGRNSSWVVTGDNAAVVIPNVKVALAALAENEYIDLTLPDIKEVPANAFDHCGALFSISAPQATKIGDEAFFDCGAMRSVDLPKATAIGLKAFEYCSEITSISLPKATVIGIDAFNDCFSMKVANLPSVTSLGDRAFFDCASLESINLTAAGNIAIGSDNPFANVNTQQCALYLNVDKKNGITTPQVEKTGKWTSQEWKTIKFTSQK